MEIIRQLLNNRASDDVGNQQQQYAACHIATRQLKSLQDTTGRQFHSAEK